MLQPSFSYQTTHKFSGRPDFHIERFFVSLKDKKKDCSDEVGLFAEYYYDLFQIHSLFLFASLKDRIQSDYVIKQIDETTAEAIVKNIEIPENTGMKS